MAGAIVDPRITGSERVRQRGSLVVGPVHRRNVYAGGEVATMRRTLFVFRSFHGSLAGDVQIETPRSLAVAIRLAGTAHNHLFTRSRLNTDDIVVAARTHEDFQRHYFLAFAIDYEDAELVAFLAVEDGDIQMRVDPGKIVNLQLRLA